jgi:hypothetical protein
MDNKWLKHGLKLSALTAVAAIAGAMAFSNGAYAQTPGPTQSAPAAARGYGMGAGMGMMAQGRMGGPNNSLVAAAAQTLNLSQADLVAALNGGKTIADVAKEKGVALDKIVDAFLTPRAEMLKTAVTAGRLTQAQADANLATLKANVTAQLSAPFTPRGTGSGTGFVDNDSDGVCDNMAANGQAATPRGPMNHGGRWGK